MNRFKELRDIVQCRFSDTSLLGLHPRLAEKARIAISALEEMIAFSEGNDISSLGISYSDLTPIRTAFFAALDKTGEKAQALGYRPLVGYLGQRSERFDIPSPVLVTLGSETSARVALVIVEFTDTNDAGYGDWASARARVAGIFADMDDATERLRTLTSAIRTISTALDEMARPQQASKLSTGPSF